MLYNIILIIFNIEIILFISKREVLQEMYRIEEKHMDEIISFMRY